MSGTSGQRRNSPAQTTDTSLSTALLEMLRGYQLSQAISVGTRLGVPDLLKDGPRSSDELARKTETHPPSLYRLLRTLSAAGLLTEHPHRVFALTPLGALLRRGGPGSFHGTASYISTEWQWTEWGKLLHTVRTGKSAPRHVWDTQEDQPETAALFNDYMTETATRRAAAVLRGYDFTGIATLVDAGGGHGRLLTSILNAYPTMRGILLDLPHVIDGAQGLLASAGVADRCECVGGSFFESVPGGADAYLLSVVIHDWDDERARTILKNCRAAMGTSSRILLVERVVPTNGKASLDVALPDLQMLVATGGCERTAQEFDALFSAAGLRLTRIVPLEFSFSVVEGVPA